MKELLLLATAVIVGVFACSIKAPSDVQSGNHGAPTATPMLDRVLLEVVTVASGAAYPKEGEILNMRLFDDGRFQYDDFPDYDPPRHTSRNVLVTRKEAVLDKIDIDKLVALAKSDEFNSSKDLYKGIWAHTDTHLLTTVTFSDGSTRKSIEIENFWDAEYDPKLKNNYPKQLVELLENVELMKAKATGKTSYQWLPKRTLNNSLKEP